MKLVRWSIVAALLLACVEASGQLSQITASNIVDGGGKKLKAGIIDFYPVTLAGNPIQPQMGGGGVILYKPAECLIVHGAITTAADGSICTTADTALSNQAHFCYKTVVKDTSVVPNNIFPAMKCLQPTGAVWNMDALYTPDSQPTAIVQLGPKGDKGDPGNGLISPGIQWALATYNLATGNSLGPSSGINTDGNGNLFVNGQTSTNNLIASNANIASLTATTENVQTANHATVNATIGNFTNNLTSPIGNLDSVFSRYLSATQSVTSPWIQGKLIGSTYQVDQFGIGSFDQLINSCITYGAIYGQDTIASNGVGNFTCDARRMTSGSNGPNTLTASGDITVTNQGVHVLLPCQSINMGAHHIIVANTSSYNVGSDTFEGCGQDATWLVFTGNDTFIQVGDPTYVQNTSRVAFKHLAINTNTGGNSAVAMAFYRTQDIEMDDVEFNGKGVSGSVQLGMLLDGTGNYSGGTFRAVHLNSYPMSIWMTGHKSGSAIGDFANASTFERLHINCPVLGANNPNGVGIYAEAADGNTWIGGDIEGCDKMVELGANAVNNTFIGVRNENSNIQYQADSGSSYNLVLFGGTLYTNQLIDYGSRNSFIDAFHHTENGIKGDWYASQQDATVVNHLRLGTGSGVVRGLQWESQVDQGTSNSIYNWIWGLTDGAAGASSWVFQDLINNTIRLQMLENNTAGGNNQTALNAAGTGNVCFNCSNNAGTGGVAFGSGGATPSTVGTIDSSGNETLYGYQRFFASGAEAWRFNCASTGSCAIDSWTSGSPVHHLRLYNGSGTDIESEASAAVTVNNSSGSGTGGFMVYGGGASPSQWFGVTGAAAFKFPGLATATSGYGDVRLDTSGWMTNAGAYTSSGTASGSTTTASHTFATAYTSTPACTATPTSNVGSFYISAQSTTSITITYSTSGSGTFNIICRGAGGIY